MSTQTVRGSDVVHWSAQQVSDWLTESLALPEHAALFLKWGIDGPTLLQLTTADLENQLAAQSLIDGGAGAESADGQGPGKKNSTNLFRDFIAVKKILGHVNIFRIQMSQDLVLTDSTGTTTSNNKGPTPPLLSKGRSNFTSPNTVQSVKSALSDSHSNQSQTQIHKIQNQKLVMKPSYSQTHTTVASVNSVNNMSTTQSQPQSQPQNHINVIQGGGGNSNPNVMVNVSKESDTNNNIEVISTTTGGPSDGPGSKISTVTGSASRTGSQSARGGGHNIHGQLNSNLSARRIHNINSRGRSPESVPLGPRHYNNVHTMSHQTPTKNLNTNSNMLRPKTGQNPPSSFRPPTTRPYTADNYQSTFLQQHKSQKGTFSRAPRRITEGLYQLGYESPGVCSYNTHSKDILSSPFNKTKNIKGGTMTRASRWGVNNSVGGSHVGGGVPGTHNESVTNVSFNDRPPPGPMSYSPRYEMASKGVRRRG